jgi:hypothetical protein
MADDDRRAAFRTAWTLEGPSVAPSSRFHYRDDDSIRYRSRTVNERMVKTPVKIVEAYRNWVPPVNAAKTVARLVAGVPGRHLAGLESIILTNSSGLRHSRRREKTWANTRKVRVVDCRGLYRQAWKGQPACIELFVDNIVKGRHPVVLRIPMLREMSFAETLYHEIGHHIHLTQAPEYRGREEVAENWERRLRRSYFWRTYWYLLAVLWPIWWMATRMKKCLQPVLTRYRASTPRVPGLVKK